MCVCAGARTYVSTFVLLLSLPLVATHENSSPIGAQFNVAILLRAGGGVNGLLTSPCLNARGDQFCESFVLCVLGKGEGGRGRVFVC